MLLVLPVVCRATDLSLWYDHPAKDWQSECLPIGNGRLGAMVYGDAQHERIQLNEDSLWTGDEKETGKYQTLGELTVDMEQGAATGYRRELDLSRARCRRLIIVRTVCITRGLILRAIRRSFLFCILRRIGRVR